MICNSPVSRIIPGPTHLRHYPAHNLVAWRPQGILDDLLLDEIGEWLCTVEKVSPQFERFVDFGRLTHVAVRTDHVFQFARKRAEQLAGFAQARSALLSEDWVGFGIAHLYEELMAGTQIDVRAFRDRAKAAVWLGVPAEILKLEDKPALSLGPFRSFKPIQQRDIGSTPRRTHTFVPFAIAVWLMGRDRRRTRRLSDRQLLSATIHRCWAS